MKKVAVVGAGAAGLCCARHLSRYPEHFTFSVFEQGSEVGGAWIYEKNGRPLQDVRHSTGQEGAPPVHSSMYKNLRTNLPKEIMLFPDFPFPAHLPSFPYHYDVYDYLKNYSKHFKLDRFIKFGTLVERIYPIPNSSSMNGMGMGNELKESEKEISLDNVRWSVTTRELASGEKTTVIYDNIFLCNGHFFLPSIPEIPGLESFPGRVIHSHVYREPETFMGEGVVVVGAGQSGRDLIIDLADHAREVFLSNRGNPLTCPLPSNVLELPAIKELHSDGGVVFSNGETRKADSIILATGYLYSFPFLSEESGLQVLEGKRVFPLYKHTINARHPSSAIIGVNFGILPFPLFDLQVRWVLSVWMGEKTLPSEEEMITSNEETYQGRLRQGLPPHKAGHHLGSVQWDFHRELAELGGSDPLDPFFEMLYNESASGRKDNLMKYKKANYRLLGRDKFVRLEDGE